MVSAVVFMLIVMLALIVSTTPMPFPYAISMPISIPASTTVHAVCLPTPSLPIPFLDVQAMDSVLFC